jgi:hypothetical protein
VRGRHKEYRARHPFGSVMEEEVWKPFSEVCRIHRLNMNVIFEEAAAKIVQDYSEGKPVEIRRKDIPTIQDGRKEIVPFMRRASPEERKKAVATANIVISEDKQIEDLVKLNAKVLH